MSDVTRILSQIESGDNLAAEQLLPLVYEERRALAAARLAHENPGQTLQATALVHEAYLRLVDVVRARRWNSRTHFLRAAAEAMRCILVDNARRKRCSKKGGHLLRVRLLHRALTSVEMLEGNEEPIGNCRQHGGTTRQFAGRIRCVRAFGPHNGPQAPRTRSQAQPTCQ